MGKKRSNKSVSVREVSVGSSGVESRVVYGVAGAAVTVVWGTDAADCVTVTPGSGSAGSSITVSCTANTWGVSRIMDVYIESVLDPTVYSTLRITQSGQ